MFGKLFGGGTPAICAHEAVIGLMSAAVASDGRVGVQELASLDRILKRVQFFTDLDESRFSTLRIRIHDRLQSEPSLHKAVKFYSRYVPKERRLACYALCMELLLSDGVVDPAEATFIGGLRRSLGVDEGSAQRIHNLLMEGHRLEGIEGDSLKFAIG